MNNFIGVIIQESILDKTVLQNIKILKTEISKVTPEHQTPHLKQWTLHTVEISPQQADKIAEKLSQTLEGNKQTGYWYADFKNDKLSYIIFPGKIFKINKSDIDGFKKAKDYGISLGIPEHQVNFESDW